MSKIRVLHIINTLNLGGAEVNLLNLTQGVSPHRFEMFVAYADGGMLKEQFETAGINLFRFSAKSCRLASLSTLCIIFRLAKFIREQGIDIVHTHTFNAHVWGGIAAKLAGAKILEHVHDPRYLEPEDFRRRRCPGRQYALVHWMRNFSDTVVVLTSQNREFILCHRLYPRKKIRLLGNGIPITTIQEADNSSIKIIRERFGISPAALVIVTPVRLVPEKNIDLILRIASHVIREVREVVFIISGEGPLRESYQNEVKRLQLDRHIQFVGFVDDTRALLNMADVFLLPSLFDLHSIALLEAMAQKRPVVVARYTGCHDQFIIDGVNGRCLDPFSDDGWAEALIHLLQDQDMRGRMGQAAYVTCCELFNIQKVSREFEAIYEQLAQR